MREYFDDRCRERLRKKKGCYKKTTEAEHGAAVTREYYITEDTGWYSEKKEWKGLKSFGMVRKKINTYLLGATSFIYGVAKFCGMGVL